MSFLNTQDGILLLAVLWALVLLGAFLALPRILARKAGRIAGKPALLLIIGVALIARLVPNLILPMGAGYDIGSYQIVGKLVLEGKDVYTSPETTNRHPYLPFQMYWMGFALWLSKATGISFVKIVRLAPICADAGIAVLLFISLQRLHGNEKLALWGGMSFAVNPIPVFVSAYHGQFDCLPILFILLSWYAMTFSPVGLFRLVVAATWLGLGILNKSWPVLALPNLSGAVRGWSKRALFLIFVGLVIGLGIGVYLLAFRALVWPMLGSALGYNHGVGAWGYTYFLQLLSVLSPGLGGPFHWIIGNGRYLTLIALGLAWWVQARKEAPEAGILTILVAFLAVTHAFSIQYLVWIVPLAVLNCERKWLTRYTLAVLSYYLLTYTTLVLDMRVTQWMPWPQADWFIIRPSELPAWLVTMAWLKNRLSGTRRLVNSGQLPLAEV